LIRYIDKNIFDTDVQEIHSFDAFYKNVILRNNNLVIPYVNLGVSQHPANLSDNVMFLDFAYMVFTGLSYLDVYLKDKRYKVIYRVKTKELYHFGGSYLDYEECVFNDMEISSDKAFLQTLQITQLSSEMWLPKALPDLRMNIDKEKVNNFFDNEFMPDNIRELVK